MGVHGLVLLGIIICQQSHWCFSTEISKNVEWVRTSQSHLLSKQLTPSGMEEGNELFLCAGQKDSRLFGGKLLATDGRMGCIGIIDYEEYIDENFLILSSPLGAVSWVPFNGSITEDSVSLGNWGDQFGERFVCRAKYAGAIIPGTHIHQYPECYIAYRGQYTVVKSLEDIEMLKVNMYGINMKLDPAIKKSTALNNIF